ncbi:MAG TPA: hypothetical protein VEB22_10220 [Phycisphaerales bacterium]|nr:hypothetical protein [Phycisphaerales bacterium]
MTNAPPAGQGRSATRWMHAAGFILGLALLGWCVWLVARDHDRIDQVKQLAQSPRTLLALLGLSVALSVCTGMMFRAVPSAVVRLPVLDVLAVNAVSTLLNNLPFKLSVVARIYLHRRRNGVPVPLVLAWMAATLCIMLIGVLPPVLVTVALKRVDASWWALVVGGTVLLAAGAVLAGRLTRSERFWSRVTARGDRHPGTLGRLTRWAGFAQLKSASDMVASAPAVAQAVAWRSAAMCLGVWRFMVAASAVGAAMTVGQCVVADSVYFSIQAAAPTGALGAREGGTVAAISSLAGESLPVVVLAVTAAETAANLLCAGAALLYLKLAPNRPPPQAPAPGNGPAPPRHAASR